MAGKTKTVNAEVVAVNEIYNVAQEQKNIEIAELKEKQARIAECNQVIGRIQATKMFVKFGNVSELMWIKDLKESGLYKDLPGIETWEKLCNSVGYSAHHISDQLKNLEALGSEFLETVSDLRVGYRELRKLRQLSHDGTISIDTDSVQINGERIPLDSAHREDLQAAIEKILDSKAQEIEEACATIRSRDKELKSQRDLIQKQERDITKYENSAKAKGLTPDEDAFLKQIEAFRYTFDGFINRFNPAEVFGKYDTVTPRMQAGLISALHYMKMGILSGYDIAVTTHGNPVMNPELLADYDRWEKANGFN